MPDGYKNNNIHNYVHIAVITYINTNFKDQILQNNKGVDFIQTFLHVIDSSSKIHIAYTTYIICA